MTHGALDSGALGKLVRLLSSDHDGEVINAARAIGRTLHSSGADWHDLASMIEGRSPKQSRRNQSDDGSFELNRYLNMKLQEAQRENATLRKWLQERSKEAEKRRKSGVARWGNLTRLERVAQLDLIAKAKWLSDGDRAYVDRLRHCLFSTPHIQTEPGDARFFNRLMDKSARRKEPSA